MVEAASKSTSIISLHEIHKRFTKVNRHRIARTYQCLTSKQQDLLDLLPYLIHVNSPGLPSYVSDFSPAGISSYAPTQKTFSALERLFPGYKPERVAHHHMEIESVFLYG
jgi:adenylate cyclase class 1